MSKDITYFKPQLYGRRFSDDTEPASSSSIWIVSFTDIMALILTFFVMTFAMSDPQDHNTRDFISGLRGEMGMTEGALRNAGTLDVIEIKKVTLRNGLDLDYINSLISTQIKTTPALSRVQIFKQNNNLILSLPQDLLFAPGKNQITTGGQAALKSLGILLHGLRNRIEVIGHTDPRAFKVSGISKSNWALSLVRAQAVSAALQKAGYQLPIVIRGASSGRYEELPGTIPESERLKYARRVDILILSDDGKVLPRLGQ